MLVVDDVSGNNELSSTTFTSVPETAPADEPTEGTTIHDAYQHVPGGVSRSHHMAPLIAAAGGLAAISLLLSGFYRMKNNKGGTQDGIIASRLQATPWIQSALLRASNWVSEPSTLTRRVGLSYCLSLTVAISFCGYVNSFAGKIFSSLRDIAAILSGKAPASKTIVVIIIILFERIGQYDGAVSPIL